MNILLIAVYLHQYLIFYLHLLNQYFDFFLYINFVVILNTLYIKY